MYAVIKTGGKQYRVSEGQILKVEKIQAEAGASVEFNEVMLIVDGESVKVGAPYVDGGKVTAKIKAQGRGPKIEIIKFKRRKHYQRRNGHRQSFTEIRITGINTAPSLSK